MMMVLLKTFYWMMLVCLITQGFKQMILFVLYNSFQYGLRT
jgi:hypothetical protein